VPPIRLAGDFPSLFTAARFQPVTRLLYRYWFGVLPGRCRCVANGTGQTTSKVSDVAVRWMLVMTVLVHCSTATPRPSLASDPSWPAVVTPTILGGPNCHPPSQLVTLLSGGGPPPLMGTPGPGTNTRAILGFFLVPAAGVEQKMILRVNGADAVAIYAQHDDGTRIQPNGVDSGHTSSSYDPSFPGTSEYGVLMTFPKPGCWQVHVQRTGAAADFYVIVG
jgi:hypothetical protein